MKKELTPKEKARIAYNAYHREWQKKNKEKVEQAKEKHFAKKYDEMKKKGLI